MPIKSCCTDHIIQASKKIFNLLKHHGEAPELHILEDDYSSDMIHIFKFNSVTYQRVPQHLHRQNATERATRTLKNYLISGLYTYNPNPPSSYWD